MGKEEALQAYLDHWDKTLESGSKREIIEMVMGGPIFKRLQAMTREELVTELRKSGRPKVFNPPDRSCPRCGDRMQFESSCSDKIRYGILGKFLCLKCGRFEVYTDPNKKGEGK